MRKSHKNFLALGLGLGLILVLELVLRLSDSLSRQCEFDPFISFREEVRVLVEEERGSEKWIVINPRLRAYFNSISFIKDKPKGTRRIFILGGSSALGFPFGQQASFSEFLSQGLNYLDSAHQYQVINLGGFGYASYRLLRLLKEIIQYQPDLIIIMTGDNEFLEKRDYGERSQARWLIEKLEHLRIYCLIRKMVFKFSPEIRKPIIAPEVKWEHYTLEPKMREMIIEHFRFNLREMARICQKEKIPVLFLTSPANLKDFPPYYSIHKKGITENELSKWSEYLLRAEDALLEKNYQQAILALERAIEIDPEYAYSWFLLGKARLGQGEKEKAKQAFNNALEKDAWQVRTISAFNQAVRELSGQEIWVLDLIPVFSAQSPDQIPGKNLFYDHCHPRLETHTLIAREIIRKLEETNWVKIPSDWEKSYEYKVLSYIDAFPSSFLAQGYYNLAVEIGINMGLKNLAKEYLELGLRLDPENPKLKILKDKLK